MYNEGRFVSCGNSSCAATVRVAILITLVIRRNRLLFAHFRCNISPLFTKSGANIRILIFLHKPLTHIYLFRNDIGRITYSRFLRFTLSRPSASDSPPSAPPPHVAERNGCISEPQGLIGQTPWAYPGSPRGLATKEATLAGGLPLQVCIL